MEVKPSDLKGQAVGEAEIKTAQIISSAKGKVLLIDEAYGLDPSRNSNSYGGNVLDVLVEKLEGSAGSDIAVIMVGYETQMRSMFQHSGNPGLNRRFNIDEALQFEDFTDADLKKVMMGLIRKENLCAEEETIDLAVNLISQRRRLDGFGNAGEVSHLLDRAKVKLACRNQQSLKEKNLSGATSIASTSTRGGRVVR